MDTSPATNKRRIDSVLGRRYHLPLTTGVTKWVQLTILNGEYGLACYEKQEDTKYKFIPILKNAHLVNNTTEKGPCLFLITSNGEFEFQAESKELFNAWLSIFVGCGVKVLTFDQLYKLKGFVGQGSFAKVYVGHHQFTGEEVCVKAIDKEKVKDSNVYTEIEMLRKVFHPYIIRLFAAYEKEDTICLVLEYLKGGELFDYISENGPYTEIHAKQAVKRILQGLHCMHRRGVIHRDLKTENLILCEKNNPVSLKIIDFGLASNLGSSTMRMRCGSPGYVAPEILEDRPYGVKVDVFSVGVVLFTILAGYPPFRGCNVKEILRKNLQCRVTFNHPRWQPVSQSVMDLILWMTSRDPDRRCTTAQALTHPWFEKIPHSIPTVDHSITASHHPKPEKTPAPTESTIASSTSTTATTTPTGSTSISSTVSYKATSTSCVNTPTKLPQASPKHRPSDDQTKSSNLRERFSLVNRFATPVGTGMTTMLYSRSGSPTNTTTAKVNPSPTSSLVGEKAKHENITSKKVNTPDNSAASLCSTSGREGVDSDNPIQCFLKPLRVSPIKLPLATVSPKSPISPVAMNLPACDESIQSSDDYIPSVLRKAFESDTRKMSREDEVVAPAPTFQRNSRRAKTGATVKKETSLLVKSMAEKQRPQEVDLSEAAGVKESCNSRKRLDSNDTKLSVSATCLSDHDIRRSQSLPSTTLRFLQLDSSYDDDLLDNGFVNLERKLLRELHDLSLTRNAEFYDNMLEDLTASAPYLPMADEFMGLKKMFAWKGEDEDETLGFKQRRMDVTSGYFRACRYAPSRMSVLSLLSRGSIKHSTKNTSTIATIATSVYTPMSIKSPTDRESSHEGSEFRANRGMGKTVRFSAPGEDSSTFQSMGDSSESGTDRALRQRKHSLPARPDTAKAAAILAHLLGPGDEQQLYKRSSTVDNDTPPIRSQSTGSGTRGVLKQQTGLQWYEKENMESAIPKMVSSAPDPVSPFSKSITASPRRGARGHLASFRDNVKASIVRVANADKTATTRVDCRDNNCLSPDVQDKTHGFQLSSIFRKGGSTCRKGSLSKGSDSGRPHFITNSTKAEKRLK